MLVNVSVALAAPETCGLKVTVNEALWPAGMVTGRGRPPRLNTELFELAAVTVTFAPLADQASGCRSAVPDDYAAESEGGWGDGKLPGCRRACSR